MAMRACRECGTEVSTTAKRCPTCGKKNPTGSFSALGCPSQAFVLLLVFVAIVMVFVLLFEGEEAPEREGPTPLPAIAEFVEDNPEYGSVRETVAMPDWARGPRQQVHTSSGNYLFYVQDGQVVTVYRYEDDSSRTQIYREPIPDTAMDVGDRPAEEGTPAYTVLDKVSLLRGGVAGDVLIESYSLETPSRERESTLRAIMAEEGMTEAYLYCSEDAQKANLSASYRESHPSTLSTCFLGEIRDGEFKSGESYNL